MRIIVRPANAAVIERVAAITGWSQSQDRTQESAAETTVRHQDNGVLVLAMPGAQQGQRLFRPRVENRFLAVALPAGPPSLFGNALFQRHARPLAQNLIPAQPGVFPQPARFAEVGQNMRRKLQRLLQKSSGFESASLRAGIERHGSKAGLPKRDSSPLRLFPSQRSERWVGIMGIILIGVVGRLSVPYDIDFHGFPARGGYILVPVRGAAMCHPSNQRDSDREGEFIIIHSRSSGRIPAESKGVMRMASRNST